MNSPWSIRRLTSILLVSCHYCFITFSRLIHGEKNQHWTLLETSAADNLEKLYPVQTKLVFKQTFNSLLRPPEIIGNAQMAACWNEQVKINIRA